MPEPTVPEIIAAPAKVETPPPATGFRAVVQHVRNWLEGYLFFPLALLSIFGAAKLAYVLTGRQPTENADFVVGAAFRLVTAILVVLMVSITQEQTSSWLSKEEKLEHPINHAIQAATKCFMAGLFAFILLH